MIAGVAANVLVWLMPWSVDLSDRSSAEDEPPSLAVFELTDYRCIVRADEDFAGRRMPVFRGHTNCPDVCPTTLSEVAAVIEGLGCKAEPGPSWASVSSAWAGLLLSHDLLAAPGAKRRNFPAGT